MDSPSHPPDLNRMYFCSPFLYPNVSRLEYCPIFRLSSFFLLSCKAKSGRQRASKSSCYLYHDSMQLLCFVVSVPLFSYYCFRTAFSLSHFVLWLVNLPFCCISKLGMSRPPIL